MYADGRTEIVQLIIYFRSSYAIAPKFQSTIELLNMNLRDSSSTAIRNTPSPCLIPYSPS